MALALAERLGGEIISVDSMQVYRGMDIGTAKPSVSDRTRVRHHLIDVADVRDGFDAARFVDLAHAALAGIQRRQKAAILCGGTGLYFNALVSGLGGAPGADPALRKEIELVPLQSLLAELEQADPETFRKIDRQNRRRIVRAVEVVRLTGRPFSAQRAVWSALSGPCAGQAAQFSWIGLDRARDDLHRRIDQRVERMFAEGLIRETQALLAHGLAENATAMQALGYRQVCAYLHGALSLEQTVALVKQKTRQYAKRQYTWFRNQTDASWIAIKPTEPPASVADRILQSWDP